ncbi:DUF4148 domain-containing protein [Paraburkholderia sp.]|uniref:DUF4148 domain-containing protein n=1 Tax=Paraburkholderia sp. TaxID=1926495 RepID=UPI002D2CC333|nr:DUF4148 domain-containing protein [Paraburkholderia sp.]HZZ04909.1 DUF4148 domain-containing protein [Paraburkholderia sp.]
MKSKRIALAALLTSALSTSALAYNDDSISAPDDPNRIVPPSSKNVPAEQPHRIGKTRAQVHKELVDARRAGIIPTTEADYPPSQRTIDANRTRYQIFERYWASKD